MRPTVVHRVHSVVLGALVAVCACSRPPGAPTTTSPAEAAAPTPTTSAAASSKASDEPLAAPGQKPAPEIAFRAGSRGLPDGWTITRREGHIEFAREDATYNSYIARGDAEIIDETWLLRRDADDTVYVSRWTPRTVSLQPNDARSAKLELGDRLVVGDWTISWIGVHEGSMAMSGKRVMHLIASRRDRSTGAWQFDGRAPATHDFPSDVVLPMHALELEVSSATFAPDARASSIIVRAREVDRAKQASYGASLEPGLHSFPDGARVRFEKNRLCGMRVCEDVHSAAIEVGGVVTPVVTLGRVVATRTAGRSFRLDGSLLRVTKP